MVLQVLEAPQLCCAGNTQLFVAVKDEAAQSTGEREKDKHEKSGRESRRKKPLVGDLKAKTEQKVGEILLCMCAPCLCLG